MVNWFKVNLFQGGGKLPKKNPKTYFWEKIRIMEWQLEQKKSWMIRWCEWEPFWVFAQVRFLSAKPESLFQGALLMKTELVLGSVTHTHTHTHTSTHKHLSKGPFHRPLQCLPPQCQDNGLPLQTHYIPLPAGCMSGWRGPHSLLLSAIKLECRPRSASIQALRGSLPLMEAHYLPLSHCGNNVFLTVFLKITTNKVFLLLLLFYV